MIKHEVKVSNSTPASKGKGHRSHKSGPVKSNAQGIKAPASDYPWPVATSKKI